MFEDTRRTFLKTVGLAVGGASVAGASGTLDSTHTASNTPSTLAGQNWSTFLYDAANTGHPPGDGVPEPPLGWSGQLSEEEISNPAVVDDVAYVVDATVTTIAFDIEAREVLWRATPDTDGSLYANGSPPTVADGTVLTTAEGMVFAQDAEDGSELWQFEVGSQLTPSVTVVDGTVYATSHRTGAKVYALDLADGSVRWDFEPNEPRANVPAVVDGVAYFRGRNAVYALDAEDGTELWRIDGLSRFGGSPSVANGSVFIVDDTKLRSFSTDDGSEQWTVEVDEYSLDSDSTPAVADGTVYVAGSGRSGSIYAYNAEDGSEVWNSWETLADTATLTVAGGNIYTAGDPIRVFDASSGDVQWQYYPRGTVEFASTVSDETVYAGDNNGYLYAFSATDDRTNWRFVTDETVESAPSVDDDTVYVVDESGSLSALDPESGEVKWQLAGSYRELTCVDETVYAYSRDGSERHIIAVDAEDGTVKWKTRLSGNVGDYEVVDGTVYVAQWFAPEGTLLYALNAETGDTEWTFGNDHSTGERATSVAVSDELVYLGETENLWALGAGDGCVEWQVSDGKFTRDANVAVADGVVYATDRYSIDDPADVFAFDASDGTALWSSEIPDTTNVSGLATTDDVVYATVTEDTESTEDKPPRLVALDADSGDEQWTVTPSSSWRLSEAVVHGDTVYVGSNRRVYAYSEDDGTELDHWEVLGTVRVKPAVTDDAVYAGTSTFIYPPNGDRAESGHVYSFRRDD
ncbi:PQQ-binding-like beta-propeller repeat protein [Haladaptatus sp. DFWS20]|uniref:outer membrane protein assembly factor BamB family protein n=1 Tax=Haladaptatus sp. DFWS20 TaxID=3403467 RepID=UPI003EC07C5C